MRRPLTFDCDGAELGATLDAGGGEVGLVMVTGGSQTRIGSHRMYERLAKALAEHRISCLRFDRRGVGDSDGADPGFRGGRTDLRAALAALRTAAPELGRVYGFGLCDGATALALFGGEVGLDGAILVNPWLVETEAGTPPPAAIRRHYRERLLSRNGWRKMLVGGVDYRKLLHGLGRIARRRRNSPLAVEVMDALSRRPLPIELVLAERDATAVAAEAELKTSEFRYLLDEVQRIGSDSHTFARPGDEAALLDAVVTAVARLEAQAS